MEAFEGSGTGRSAKWTYICCVVMGHQYYMLNDTCEKVSDVTKKASSTPVYLGKGILGRDKKEQHEGYFYLYKGRINGRKSAHPKLDILAINHARI